MITYVAVGWAIRSFYFNEIDREMGTQVQEGKLAMNLIRPVDFQTVMIADAAGQSAFRAVLFTVPISFVLALLFPLKPPASLAAGAALPRLGRALVLPRRGDQLPRRPDRDPLASRSWGSCARSTWCSSCSRGC